MLNFSVCSLNLFRQHSEIPIFTLGYKSNTETFSLKKSAFSQIFGNVFYSSFALTKKQIRIKDTQFRQIMASPIYIKAENKAFSKKVENRIEEKDKKLEIENCIFDKCSSNENGGAIYAENSSVFILNSIFDKIQTTECGGAMYFEKCTEIYVHETIFQQDYAQESSPTLHSFFNWGIFMENCNISQEISDNRCASTSIISTDTINMNHVQFLNSSSRSFGALRATSGTLEFNNCNMIEIKSDSCICTHFMTKFKIKRCYFLNSTKTVIDWNSNLNCIISFSHFSMTEDESLTGKGKSNFVIGPMCFFSSTKDIHIPTLFGTSEVPTKITGKSKRTKALHNKDKNKGKKKKNKKIDIILDNPADNINKEKPQVIVVSKVKLLTRSPLPTINKNIAPVVTRDKLFDTQQIALFGLLILVVIIVVVYRLFRRNKVPDQNNNNTFVKLEKSRSNLPRGMLLDDADSFLD